MAIKKSILRKIAKIQSRLHDLSEEMMEKKDDMQENFDRKSEKFKESEKWEEFESGIEELNDAALDVWDASERLRETLERAGYEI